MEGDAPGDREGDSRRDASGLDQGCGSEGGTVEGCHNAEADSGALRRDDGGEIGRRWIEFEQRVLQPLFSTSSTQGEQEQRAMGRGQRADPPTP